MTAGELAPGQRVGDYEVVGAVGHGASGTVYEATHLTTSRRVALKVLQRAQAASSVAVERLRREARIIAALDHPHIVTLFEAGAQGSEPFLAMELLTGEGLDARLARERRLTVSAAVDLLLPVLDAVSSAHRRGVVHRDLKPANVFLARRGADGEVTPKLLDFGLAKVLEGDASLTRSRTAVGTPFYMSPEQAYESRSVGAASDQWSLAVVLYECVTGERPFEGQSVLAVLTAITTGYVMPPSVVRAGVPEAFDEVVLRALQHDPSRRHPSVRDFAAALLPFASEPARARWTPLFVAPGLESHPSASDPEARPYSPRGALPAERDAFVGRGDDLRTLDALLREGARLVSVLGLGGAGKTRLVVRHAWASLARWPGGVWFCDLVEARDASGVAAAVARALDVPLHKGDPVAQLGHVIASRGRCLVVLDNFEQVSAHAAATLGAWLDRAPEARFVVTSRVVLGLAGECTFALAPLSGDDGVALFLERARAAKRDFVLTDEERPAVIELVRLLDGLPLAIELAAARVRVMSVRGILERMGDRFRLLSSSGGRSDRHATLRAALDGSWELLSLWEKRALAQMSVFAGGFTLAAAEAVLDLGGDSGAPWTVDVVQALVDKSLVRPDGDDRFDLLVSVHEYAAARLRSPNAFDRSGPEAVTSAEARHGAWAAELGAGVAIEALEGRGDLALRRALAREIENLRAALPRALARNDGDVVFATARAACAVLTLQGPFAWCVELIEPVSSRPSLSRTDRAEAAWIAGRVYQRMRQYDRAREHLDAALALARDIGDRRREALVHCVLSDLDRTRGDQGAARAQVDAACALAEADGDARVRAVARFHLGNLYRQDDLNAEALVHYEAALALAREAGDRYTEGVLHSNLCNLHTDEGRYDAARACGEAALVVTRAVGNRRIEGGVRSFLGSGAQMQGRLDDAHAHYTASLVIAREIGEPRDEGWALGRLGLLRLRAGDFDEAERLITQGEKLLRDAGDPYDLAEILAWRAEAAWRRGDIDRARSALAECDARIAEVGAGPLSEPGKASAQVHARIDGG